MTTLAIVIDDSAMDDFGKSSDSSQMTDITSIPSSDNSITDVSDDDGECSISESKKSVRFSSVYIREYNVIEEVCADNDDDTNDDDEEGPIIRKSLGWEYKETQSDLESHQEEARRQRKDRYIQMIQEHIIRGENRKEEQEKRKNENKKKGFRSKVLKPLWKGFIEAASRSSLVIPNPI